VKYGTGVLQQQRRQLAEKADRCVGTADFERIVQMFGSIDSWSIISYGMCQRAKAALGFLERAATISEQLQGVGGSVSSLSGFWADPGRQTGFLYI